MSVVGRDEAAARDVRQRFDSNRSAGRPIDRDKRRCVTARLRAMKRRGASSAVRCIDLVRMRVSERVGDREDVPTVTMCDRMHTKQNVESRKREEYV